MSSRRRRRNLKGGGWNQIINQAVAPIALLGMSYIFNKRSNKRSAKKRSDKKRSYKRSDKRSDKKTRRRR